MYTHQPFLCYSSTFCWTLNEQVCSEHYKKMISWMLWQAAWQVTELKWTRSNSFKRSGPSRICVRKSRQLCSRCRDDTRHEFQRPQIWRDDDFLGECELLIIGWSFEQSSFRHFKTMSSMTSELFMQQNFSKWRMVSLVPTIFRRIKVHKTKNHVILSKPLQLVKIFMKINHGRANIVL